MGHLATAIEIATGTYFAWALARAVADQVRARRRRPWDYEQRSGCVLVDAPHDWAENGWVK